MPVGFTEDCGGWPATFSALPICVDDGVTPVVIEVPKRMVKSSKV